MICEGMAGAEGELAKGGEFALRLCWKLMTRLLMLLLGRLGMLLLAERGTRIDSTRFAGGIST